MFDDGPKTPAPRALVDGFIVPQTLMYPLLFCNFFLLGSHHELSEVSSNCVESNMSIVEETE